MSGQFFDGEFDGTEIEGGLDGDMEAPELSWEDAALQAGYCKKSKCTPEEIAKFAEEKIPLPGDLGADGLSWGDAASAAGYCKKSKCTPKEIA